MDTVVYKLHNPQTYPIIIKSVQELKDGKGLLMFPTSETLRKEKEFDKAWFNIKTNYYGIMQYNVKADLPSGATGVNILYDEQQDFIKFEFSIPKFFFGNNVCELIPAMQSKWYNPSDLTMMNLAKYWYRLLKVLFQKLIHDLTRGLFIGYSWTDVEIARLDLPFNQMFDSRDDCLHYLEALKRVGMSKLGESAQHDFATAATWSTDSWYYKVYHKGAEFEKIGRKQIRNHYDDYFKKGLLYDGSAVALAMTNIDALGELADRTLRYELEVKKGLMNDLYNKYLKKHNIKEYGILRRHVKYVMREENYTMIRKVIRRYRDDSGEISSARTNRFLKYDELYYLPHCDLVKGSESIALTEVTADKLIARIARLFKSINLLKVKFFILNFKQLKEVSSFLNKEDALHHQFFFDIEEVDAAKAILRERSSYHYDCDAMTLLEATPKKQKFSSALLHLFILKANQFFQRLQFESLPGRKNVELLCNEYNKTIEEAHFRSGKKEQKMNVNQMKLLVDNLTKFSWKQLKKSRNYDRTTVFRWQKKLEKLVGFGKAVNFIPGLNLENVSRKPSTLYFRHYDEMLEQKNVISVFLQNTPLLLTI